MQLRPVGADALLIEVDSPLDWFAALDAERAAGRLPVIDIVPGARTVLLDGVADPAGLAARLSGWQFDPASVPPAPPLTVDVHFDGVDLPFVAELAGLDIDGVVDVLTGTELTVAFCGFAPGFAYLAGLPWNVPRLGTPRTRVPAGSVALAAEFAGIYPTPSPGGWRIVGHSTAELFDVARTPPALMTPGRTVRFRAA
ncbi:5-oxoprolinase subunit B family protein [Dactylosporangium sp. CS-033363]|uniref:5-oxoprolinase subunit B family protein n=1 Tax=Dactylosporangium sp. CS-033363 TaxID=3239935 RepID=UPI003D8AB1C4